MPVKICDEPATVEKIPLLTAKITISGVIFADEAVTYCETPRVTWKLNEPMQPGAKYDGSDKSVGDTTKIEPVVA